MAIYIVRASLSMSVVVAKRVPYRTRTVQCLERRTPTLWAPVFAASHDGGGGRRTRSPSVNFAPNLSQRLSSPGDFFFFALFLFARPQSEIRVAVKLESSLPSLLFPWVHVTTIILLLFRVVSP